MSGRRSPSTFTIRTFGCQMNEHDSEKMSRLLLDMGLRPAGDSIPADLVIINTCSVRAKPEHKALSEAGRYQSARRHRGTLVLLTGCVAQQEGQKLLKKVDYLDAVLGPDAIGRLPDIVSRLSRGQGPLLDVQLHTRSEPRFINVDPPLRAGPKALVTIMKGCDNFCSYCIVPYVRGREVSRPAGDILREVESLARAGCREVTLLGQNVNSYHDARGTGFAQLLRALDEQAAVERIRFTSSHPRDVDEQMIAVVAECQRVCEHVHLGLQSGSDSVLRRMNRGYRGDEFLDKALRLRQVVPQIAITTDIIVGFPGENESDFQRTLAIVEQVRFDQAYSFKYSPRPLTAAARWPDDVPAEIKTERLERLQLLISECEQERLSLQVGSRQQVLVEGTSIRDSQAWRGRTRSNQVVNFSSNGRLLPGQLVEVEIVEVRGHTLWGRMLDNG